MGEGSRGGGAGNADRATQMVNHRLTAASLSKRNTNRYSVTALYSMAAEQDVEVEDDLARGELRVCSVRIGEGRYCCLRAGVLSSSGATTLMLVCCDVA